MKSNDEVKIERNLICVRTKSKSLRFSFSEIQQIKAYKIDKLTYDEICMDIVLEKEIITINEDFNGWHTFISYISEVDKNIDRIWKKKVLSEPFKRNEVVLYNTKSIKKS